MNQYQDKAFRSRKSMYIRGRSCSLFMKRPCWLSGFTWGSSLSQSHPSQTNLYTDCPLRWPLLFPLIKNWWLCQDWLGTHTFAGIPITPSTIEPAVRVHFRPFTFNWVEANEQMIILWRFFSHPIISAPCLKVIWALLLVQFKHTLCFLTDRNKKHGTNIKMIL